MTETTTNEYFAPENPDQLRELVTWAISERKTIYAGGLNTKSTLGHPVEDACDLHISLKAFNTIDQYNPAELVMTAGAGTSFKQIQETLAKNNQILAFDPPILDGLFRDNIEENNTDANNVVGGSIGGVFACNLSGSRRLSAGAARDHLLGFQAISGRGEAFKSGGQVMKNVTGYDLSKLLCGSYGTLGLMHQLSFKVLPKPEESRTLIVTGVDAKIGNVIMNEAMKSNADVCAASWLPSSLLDRFSNKLVSSLETDIVACRLEGPKPSVIQRLKFLRDKFSPQGKIEELHDDNSHAFWDSVKNVTPFAKAFDNRVLWRISVPPASGASFIEELKSRNNLENWDAYMDWAGGLIWLAIDAPKMGAADLIRGILSK
ncbi:MAG: FAD-binding protein, partial [Alphaproteobacteria bacterium]|nr:FAD-binding protein [Alphaproteobacteria bacterium]